MKLVLGIILLCSTLSLAQKSDAVHCVYFFKSSNDNGYKEAIFQVDSVGNVVERDNPTGQKVNLKSFTNSVNTFVRKENLRLVSPLLTPGELEENYEGSEEAYYPNEGEQVLYISVVFVKDHVVGADFSGEAYYSYEFIGPNAQGTEYALYRYLSPSDLKIIKSRLEY